MGLKSTRYRTGTGPAEPSTRSTNSSTRNRAFELAQQAARRAVRRRLRVAALTKDAYVKIERYESALARVVRDLRSLTRFARAWAAREYVDAPWRTVVYVVAAIIYFLNPADLVPDLLTGIGFVDDAAVVGLVVRSVHDDLAAFRNWERDRIREERLRQADIRPLRPGTSAAA